MSIVWGIFGGFIERKLKVLSYSNYAFLCEQIGHILFRAPLDMIGLFDNVTQCERGGKVYQLCRMFVVLFV